MIGNGYTIKPGPLTVVVSRQFGDIIYPEARDRFEAMQPGAIAKFAGRIADEVFERILVDMGIPLDTSRRSGVD